MIQKYTNLSVKKIWIKNNRKSLALIHLNNLIFKLKNLSWKVVVMLSKI